MMRLSALGAVLVGTASAQMDPAHMMMAFMQEQMDLAHAEIVTVPFVPQEPAMTCGQCVEEVASRMLEAAASKMRSKCANGEGCPHACQRLKEDSRATMGVLTVRTRPVSMAANFCTGKGVCAAGEVSQSAALKAGTLMHLAYAAEKDLEEAVHGVEQEEGPMDKVDAGRKGWKALMPPADPKCVETTIAHVMEKVESFAGKACEERQLGLELIKGLPVGGGACELRSTRPEFFHGMLLGKVEPWKFAKGYCLPHAEAAEPLMTAFNWVKSAVATAQQRIEGMQEGHQHEEDEHHHHEHEGRHHEERMWGERKHHEEHQGRHHEGHMWWGKSNDHEDGQHSREHGKPCPHHEKVMACHRQCGHDAECHQKCPQPWKHLADACAARDSAKQCLAACDGGVLCHLRCLSPISMPRVAHVASHLACNAWCRSDSKCLERCSMERPHMAEKCARLAEVKDCHHKCAHGDFGCHMQCPQMFEHHHHFEHEGRRQEPQMLPAVVTQGRTPVINV